MASDKVQIQKGIGSGVDILQKELNFVEGIFGALQGRISVL